VCSAAAIAPTSHRWCAADRSISRTKFRRRRGCWVLGNGAPHRRRRAAFGGAGVGGAGSRRCRGVHGPPRSLPRHGENAWLRRTLSSGPRRCHEAAHRTTPADRCWRSSAPESARLWEPADRESQEVRDHDKELATCRAERTTNANWPVEVQPAFRATAARGAARRLRVATALPRDPAQRLPRQARYAILIFRSGRRIHAAGRVLVNNLRAKG
jgi:hypothetical protein